ncbi:MAG: 4Fe-4S dicluster domain-containing protein [Desulfobacteraceae bacterium]
MKNVIVKKGYDLRLSGSPASELEVLKTPSTLGVLPEHIPFIIPRLRVEKGQKVKIGTPLFEDKRDMNLVFLSPGAGVITDIRYGQRRVIQEIVIDLDEIEAMEEFPRTDLSMIESMDPSLIKERLVKGGVWPFLRALPFRDIAGRDSDPSSIVVSLNGKDSFAPSPSLYLRGKEDLFLYGLSVLRKLTKTVHIMASGDCGNLSVDVKNTITHTTTGPYPSDDPGVLLYHIKQTKEENKAFFIDGQDLVLLAQLMRDGVYPSWKVIATGGPACGKKKHFRVRVGSPVKALQLGSGEESTRVVAGGVMRGYNLPSDSYLGYYESSLTVLNEGDEEEFLGFLRAGYNRPSFTRTFLSAFNRKDFSMNCNMHGELRPCINCGACASVCPVDILPQFAFKCLQAGEVEEGLAHGLLDCVECALCTYVCPSKVDVCAILKKAKADYSKEQA